MKKVAIVLLTLCLLTGLAGAGYVEIRAVGNTSNIITASTGDTLTIQVSVSGFSDQVLQTLAIINFDITEQVNNGAIEGAASNGTVATSVFDNYSHGTLVNSDGTLIRNVTASRSVGTTQADPDWTSTPTVVYTFSYTVGNLQESGSAVISLSNTGSGVPMFGDVMGNALNDVTVSNLTVVPEPLTFALLGLGGLLIRKRS